jgi:hypothetical protein
MNGWFGFNDVIIFQIEREPSLINPSKSKNFKRFGKSKIKLLNDK